MVTINGIEMCQAACEVEFQSLNGPYSQLRAPHHGGPRVSFDFCLFVFFICSRSAAVKRWLLHARCCHSSAVYKSHTCFHFFHLCSDICIFFKKYLLHTELTHSSVQCIETVVPMYYVSYFTCNEGECVVDIQYIQKGSLHRQESLVSPAEGSPDRSATGALTLGRSTSVFELW